MKKLFLYFLLCNAFLLGSTQVANADYTLDDVIVVDIVNNKTGTVMYSFEIPEKYTTKNGKLAVPIEITLSNEKNTAFTTQSTELNIILPANLSGCYLLEVKIGDYECSREIKF